MPTIIKKLNLASLKNASGGGKQDVENFIIYGSITSAALGSIGGSACAIASAVYNQKASNALKQDDMRKREKYAETAKSLSIAAASLGGLTVLSGSVLPVSLLHSWIRRH